MALWSPWPLMGCMFYILNLFMGFFTLPRKQTSTLPLKGYLFPRTPCMEQGQACSLFSSTSQKCIFLPPLNFRSSVFTAGRPSLVLSFHRPWGFQSLILFFLFVWPPLRWWCQHLFAEPYTLSFSFSPSTHLPHGRLQFHFRACSRVVAPSEFRKENLWVEVEDQPFLSLFPACNSFPSVP